MTALGINNPNSLYNRSLRTANIDRIMGRAIRRTVTPGDVENLKFFVRGRLSVAQYHADPVRVREFQAQLVLLDQWGV